MPHGNAAELEEVKQAILALHNRLIRAQQLENILLELIEVASLRGDNDLPHPANDPKLWTARMQDAWSKAEALVDPEKLNIALEVDRKVEREVCKT
jgi:hypothetical protein